MTIQRELVYWHMHPTMSMLLRRSRLQLYIANEARKANMIFAINLKHYEAGRMSLAIPYLDRHTTKHPDSTD